MAACSEHKLAVNVYHAQAHATSKFSCFPWGECLGTVRRGGLLLIMAAHAQAWVHMTRSITNTIVPLCNNLTTMVAQGSCWPSGEAECLAYVVLKSDDIWTRGNGKQAKYALDLL